jgi:hypothetical protein
MAFPTAVNSQITDAVTQSNTKVVAESPAYAMGMLYQTLAHSTGILFQNAVSAQQQQYVTAQAATIQGVALLYSLDTAAAAATTEKVGQSDAPDALLSLLTALKGTGEQATPKAVAIAAPQAHDTGTEAKGDTTEPAVTQQATTAQTLLDQIQATVTFSNDLVLGSAPRFVDGLRSLVETLVHALQETNRIDHERRARMLKEAALAATCAAMIRKPEQSAEYDAVLQAIHRMA